MSVKNLGRVRLVYKGTWSNSTAYKRMDIVYKNGNAYYALVDNSAKDPELGANSGIWGILNRRGSVVQLNSPSVSVLTPKSNPTATTISEGPDGIDKKITFGLPRAPKPNPTGYHVINPDQFPSVTQEIDSNGDFSFTFSLPNAPDVSLKNPPAVTRMPNQDPLVTATKTNGNVALQFEIPRSALVGLGTLSILNPNQNPVITRTVDANGDVSFNFSIPRAATISVGTTTPLNPNQNPTVSKTGENGDAIFNFGIPKAATVSVGSTSTGNTGTAAIVTNTGTNGDVVLNFTIPKGDTGGAPKGVYPTLAALQAAFPTGDSGAIYVVTEDAQWYFYDNGWLPGGGYTTDNIPAPGVKINDLGNFYNGENVELALQEIGQVLTEWDCGVF